MNNYNKAELILADVSERSAWMRGVKAKAIDMLAEMYDQGINVPTRADLLNGASDWQQWAYGGCGLVYDADIAEAYSTPSELKRTKGGCLPPNSRESWLDVEARAAFQAANLILRRVK